MEVTGVLVEKECQQKRIERKVNEVQNQHDYTTKLLQACKSWNSPCTTGNELQEVLPRRPDMNEKIVKTELSYYRNTHKADRYATPELFKVAKIPHEERLENLFILLSDNRSSTSIIDLPTNKEVLCVICSPSLPNAEENPVSL